MDLKHIVLLLLTSLLFSYIVSSTATRTLGSHILKQEESTTAQNLPGGIPVSNVETALEREAGSSTLTLLGTKRTGIVVEPQSTAKMESKMAIDVLDYAPPGPNPIHTPPPPTDK